MTHLYIHTSLLILVPQLLKKYVVSCCFTEADELSPDTERSSPDGAADQKTHVVAVLVVAVGIVLFA